MSTLHTNALFFRPLAASLDDKVILQDCLEIGRKAKVGGHVVSEEDQDLEGHNVTNKHGELR